MGEALKGVVPPSRKAARFLRSPLTLLRVGGPASDPPAREGRPPPPAHHRLTASHTVSDSKGHPSSPRDGERSTSGFPDGSGAPPCCPPNAEPPAASQVPAEHKGRHPEPEPETVSTAHVLVKLLLKKNPGNKRAATAWGNKNDNWERAGQFSRDPLLS